jgi:hypothetical protein
MDHRTAMQRDDQSEHADEHHDPDPCQGTPRGLAVPDIPARDPTHDRDARPHIAPLTGHHYNGIVAGREC